MPKPIQTDRLILKPVTSDDYAFIRSLHGSPEVMRYIGSGLPRTEEQSKMGLERMLKIQLDTPLLGAWIAYLKDSGEPVGNLILRKPATAEETEGLEIGYSFAEAHWGQGYATECSRGMIEYAYQEFGPVRIVALIEPKNDASRKTLMKLGFISVGTTQYSDPTSGLVKPTEILEIKPYSVKA
jgi:RimJ/RimL family protein N-acetyltransferase